MTKVLFLDFDGVLHPASARADQYFCRAALLVQALEAADVQIVISSSWRFSQVLDDLRSMLPIDVARRVIGVTGEAYIGRFARHEEILAFARRHPRLGQWIAVDDSGWEFPRGAPLVLCDPNTGLTSREVESIRRWAL